MIQLFGAFIDILGRADALSRLTGDVMRIVTANKYNFLKSGVERYIFELNKIFEGCGHEVIPFAMQGDKNEPTEWDRYFVSSVQTAEVTVSPAGLKTAGRVLYSFEARRRFGALLDEAKPNLLHAHSIYHQISPSILPQARKRGIPTVMTAHDYNLVAPNYSLFHDEAICEHSKPDRYWNAVVHRCVKGSALASMLDAAAMSLHQKLGLYRKNIDRIIVPSRFMAALFEDYGIPREVMTHIPHFIDAGSWKPRYEGDYVLYVGRLSEEKGVDVLIRAAKLMPEVTVRIVGTGPEKERILALVEELGAKNVEFAGFREGLDLKNEYAGARMVVVPSVCYETFGLTVLEAYAAGKPVVASRLGGLTENVKEGETGILFSAGDAQDLAEQVSALWNAPHSCGEFGMAGRKWVEEEFSPGLHYERLLRVYGEVRGLSQG